MFNPKNQNLIRTIVGTAGMIACAAACLFAASAGAQTVDNATRSHAVMIADLDLSTTNGRLALDGRLKRAANSVCASTGALSLNEEATRRRCIQGAMEAALPSVSAALDAAIPG